MTPNYPTIKANDSELYEMIMREQSRQEEGIELIASENIVPLGVLEIQGSVLTNKYAEGYPKKRYYGGCEYVDEAEQLAIDRACQLFGAKFANVQPHSGSQANQSVFFAELKPGDQILGMNLSEGGHLTHGSPVNLSGKLFKSDFYGINEEGLLDYTAMREKALALKPKMIIAGASAYSRVIDFKKFREVADECGALLLVDMAHIAGLVAAGLHPSPVEYADYVTTTTHKTLRGGRGGLVLTNTPERIKKINSVIFPGIQGGPLVHAVVGKAHTFKKAMEPEFKAYQTQVVANARVFAEEMLKLNYKLVSGGTDNHLILVDLVDKGITGKQLENSLDLAGITLNKNAVPNDPQSPFVTSGVRIGTPAMTSRGMKEAECRKIVVWIDRVVEAVRSGEEDNLVKVCGEVKAEVKVFTKDFPIYFT